MDEQRFVLARAGLQCALALAATLLVAACNPLGGPPDVSTQPTRIVGQANLQATAGQPAYPAPSQAPARPTVVPATATPLPPLTITIDTPPLNTLVGSPVVITGHTDRPPRGGILNYRFVDRAGQELGKGNFPVNGVNFNARLTFNLPRDGGPVSTQIFERGNAAGQDDTATLNMLVDAQYQDIFIDTPADGTVVGNPVVLTGRTTRGPHGDGLGYSIFNSAGQQIGGDAFPVFGDPGGQRGFNAELFFNYPIDGDTIRVDLYDWNPATNKAEVVRSKSLVVLPIPQQIIFDTPPAMTLVGSPVVITGRTTRYPFNGDLQWRITTDSGKQIGGGNFQVSGPAGQATSFNTSLNFQIPRDGGTMHLEVYDQDPSNGASVASTVLDVDVLAQYQAIVIDTPPPGTQVGSPVVLTGRTNLYPNGGQLQYRVINSAGQQIGGGAVDVGGGPGQRGSFAASLTFDEPANGGNIRVEMVDRGANGATAASAAIDLFVAAPPPQQIFIDTPGAGTQVGSPVVLTGRTARYPASGKLNYRVLDASGAVIGSGQFDVAQDSAGSRAGSFNASITFAEPPGGGNITIALYVPSQVSSAIVSSSISLYVAPRQ